MQVTVTFDSTPKDVNMQKILQKKATANGVTIEDLIENWIENWAESQFRSYYYEKVRAMTNAQLIGLLGEIT